MSAVLIRFADRRRNVVTPKTVADNACALAFALALHAFVLGLLFFGSLRHPEPSLMSASSAAIEATFVTSVRPAYTSSPAVRYAESADDHNTTPSLSKPDPLPQTAQIDPQSDQPDMAGQQRTDAESRAKFGDGKQSQDERAQLHNAVVPAPSGGARPPITNNGEDPAGLLERYQAALNKTATSNWNPVGVPPGVHCTVSFTQISGGEVIDVRYENCPFDAVARESTERAMHKGSMPYAGFETVFSRQATIDFCYPEETCAK